VRGDGQLMLGNRAARALIGEETPRLADVPAIGPVAAERLMRLPAGAREIVHLKAEQRMLASVALFRGADGVPQRLISLQGLASELSAVETRAWQDLVRILAHEMMNSLTPIVSMTETLQAVLHPLSGEAADVAIGDVTAAVDTIGRRSAGLMRFVERYRQVAELPEPRPQAVVASDLVAQIEQLASVHFERAESFRGYSEPPDLIFEADPDLLEQALINLVKNAVEAVAESSDPRVTLACRAVDGQIRIEIADNGRGLPRDDPEKIFTPFFTTKPGGSGIGLALARQIAVAHGGELTVRRGTPGAVFTLSLPLRAQMNGAE
jgi:nitrogen fixation/metabolism regulation signal transduction histidine kinase